MSGREMEAIWGSVGGPWGLPSPIVRSDLIGAARRVEGEENLSVPALKGDDET